MFHVRWGLGTSLGILWVAFVVMPISRALHLSDPEWLGVPQRILETGVMLWPTYPATLSTQEPWMAGGFVVGLQFGWLTLIPMVRRFVLVPSMFSGDDDARRGLLFMLGVVVALIMTANTAWQASAWSRQARWVGLFVLLFGLSVIITLSMTFYAACPVHIHHYMLGLVLVLTTRRDDALSGIMYGLGHGVLIDGLVQYGPAHLWPDCH